MKTIHYMMSSLFLTVALVTGASADDVKTRSIVTVGGASTAEPLCADHDTAAGNGDAVCAPADKAAATKPRPTGAVTIVPSTLRFTRT